ILYIWNLGNVDVEQLATNLLDLADIDGLDDVARFRIDRDRTAGAFPLHALGCAYQTFAVNLAFGLCERSINEMHAVPATGRKEIRVTVVIGVVGFHESLIHLRLVVIVVMAAGDDADGKITHALERVLVSNLELAHDVNLLGVDTAFGKSFAERARLSAPRNEDVDGFRVQVLRALHVSGEIRIGNWHAHRTDDLAAAFLEAFLEPLLGVVAGTVVRHHSVGLLDPAFGRSPFAKRIVELGNGERRPRHVWRLGGDDRGRRVHHHHELFRFSRNIAGGHRVRREHEAGED